MLPEVYLKNTTRSLDFFPHLRDGSQVLLNPPYQRGDVWGPVRRVNFIRSLLMEIPIPSLVLNDRLYADWVDGDFRFAVVDGRQRITTILRFFDSQLAVPGHWFDIDAPSVVYRDLPLKDQRRFGNKGIAVSEARLSDLAAEQEVFDLINFGGVPQGSSDVDAEPQPCSG
jgi:hypothetical protein